MRKAVSLTLSVILNLLLVIGISKVVSVKEEKRTAGKEALVFLSFELDKLVKNTQKTLIKKESKRVYKRKTVKRGTIGKRENFKAKRRKKATKETKIGKKKLLATHKVEKKEETESGSQKTKEQLSGKEINKEIGQVRKEAAEGKEKLKRTKLQKEEKEEKSFNLNAYKRKVIEVVEKKKFYPPLARRLGIEGEVKVVLVIGKKGELLKAETLSGNRILKKAAVKLLKKCKFPPLPENFKEREVKLELSISYKLYQAP